MTTTLRRVKKLLRRSKHVTDQSLLFNQSNCCYVATQKKVMATTYYVIYIHTIGSATLLQTYPLVAIPTVIIFPMKLTRKWFLIIVSAVTPVIYRLFIYECSIYSKLGIKKKRIYQWRKRHFGTMCVIWCYQFKTILTESGSHLSSSSSIKKFSNCLVIIVKGEEGLFSDGLDLWKRFFYHESRWLHALYQNKKTRL